MWYRLSQNILEAQAVGGGIKRTPTVSPVPVVQNSGNDPQQKVWDTLVEQNDHVGTPVGQINETAFENATMSEGPATQGTEMRRLSPYHNNPEHTTLETQLETARQQNVNVDPVSMSQQQPGDMLVKGIPQYNSGKGWKGFQGNLPSTNTLV
jgi:hypothetical protein